MKLHGILGYATILWIVVLFTKKCECATKLDTKNVKQTAKNDTGTTIHDEDEDFVPYENERLSVFDWALFKAIGRNHSGNILISPISIKMALVLLYEGAQDQTAYELAGAMQLPASRSATREQFSRILQSLQEPSPSYTLDIGTRLYIDTNVLIRQRYEAIIKAFYNTDVITRNMSNAHSVATEINSWVSHITHGSINKMIEDEEGIEKSVMLIMNAMFFKGAWRQRYFDPENTRIKKFYTSSNEAVDVPFMHTVTRLFYSESSELNAKILRIPYDGGKFAMYLILPNTKNGTDELIKKVNPSVLTRHVWLMQDLAVDLAIPKFKFEFSSHLEPVLRELGIRDIFDDSATLTGIARTKRTSSHLQVSDVLQKTGIEVNENGTSAYVATEVQIANKIEAETFHADHPFLFYILDESTTAILYVGRVANPLQGVGSTGAPSLDLSSRFGEDTENTASLPVPTSEERYNFFNVDLLQTINEDYEGNVVLSPASAKLALTVLAEGSGGRSRDELLSVLRLPEDPTRIRDIARRTFAPLKRSENGTESDSATRLWVREELQVSPVYAQTLQRYYGGGVQHIDFSNSQVAANNINDWVRRVTRNNIKTLANSGSVTPETRLLLTSALYFKGQWLKAFNKQSTVVRCFNDPNAGCHNAHFMESTSRYRYAYIPSLEADVVEIPYSDRKTSMLILLPSSSENGRNLRILSKDLSYIPVSALLSSLTETELHLSIPKFSIESKLDLRPSLTRLGVHDIFGVAANLSGIANDNTLKVGSILQNAKIEVDEDGTVASAVTVMEITPLIGLSTPLFRADHPFIFMIVDLETKGTLFSGRVSLPEFDTHNTLGSS